MTASQPDGVLAVHSIQPWKKRKRTEEITVQFIADDSTKTPKGERKREKKKSLPLSSVDYSHRELYPRDTSGISSRAHTPHKDRSSIPK